MDLLGMSAKEIIEDLQRSVLDQELRVMRHERSVMEQERSVMEQELRVMRIELAHYKKVEEEKRKLAIVEKQIEAEMRRRGWKYASDV